MYLSIDFVRALDHADSRGFLIESNRHAIVKGIHIKSQYTMNLIVIQ